MKRISFLIVIIFSAQLVTAGPLEDFTDKADAFFKKYVISGKVKYSSVKANKAELNSLVTSIGSMSLAGKTNSQKKTFLINAYNILVIKGIVDKYPVYGPLKINGFFKVTKYKVAGKMVTLDALEKQELKKTGVDPRLHFALVCAANGCPKIANFAFRPEKVSSQLSSRTRIAMKSTYFIRVKKDDKKVLVSQIFEWYKPEFIKNAGSILKYVNKYRSDDNKIPSSYKVGYYTYDWKLNEKK